jgi:hypothetical protein
MQHFSPTTRLRVLALCEEIHTVEIPVLTIQPYPDT